MDHFNELWWDIGKFDGFPIGTTSSLNLEDKSIFQKNVFFLVDDQRIDSEHLHITQTHTQTCNNYILCDKKNTLFHSFQLTIKS